MKFFRTGLLALLLVLALIVLVTLSFAGDPLFVGALRRYAPPALGQPLDFTDASLSVLGGSAEVDDLVIGNREDPLAEVGKVRLDTSTSDLLAGRFRIEEATLADAVLHLSVDENGRLSIDPGPPPAGTETTPPPPASADTPPPARRDFVQIVQEYWDRLQTYRDYYRKVGAFGGKDAAEAEAGGAAEQGARRLPHPGMASFLEQSASSTSPTFLRIDHAELSDFRWETLDRRTGKPLLPPLDSLSLTLDRLGSSLPGETSPAKISGDGLLSGGGAIRFVLALARGAESSTLAFSARDLPAAAIADLIASSVPFRLSEGLLDLDTEQLAFTDSSLAGTLKLTLRKGRLEAAPGAPKVLGMDATQFCSLLDRALAQGPVSIAFVLGGTPTHPSFEIQNDTELGDLLKGAVKAEVKERGQKLLDEQKSKLGKKASGLLKGLKGH